VLGKPFGRRSLLRSAAALTAASLAPWAGGCASDDDDALTFFFAANPGTTICARAGNRVRRSIRSSHGRRPGLHHHLLEGTRKAFGILPSSVARSAPFALASCARCPSVICFAALTHPGR